MISVVTEPCAGGFLSWEARGLVKIMGSGLYRLRPSKYRPAMNRMILATLSALSLLCVTDARAQPPELTTHDVANCRSETDLAICLLGVEARDWSFRRKPEFAHAPDVLAQLDRWKPSSADPDSSPGRAYYEASIRPYQESQSVVISVLEADQRGTEPAAALLPLTNFGRDIRPQSFIFGQIVTAGGEELRVIGLQEIWDAYAQSIGRGRIAGQSKASPPSRGLAVAALAAWEQEIVSFHRSGEAARSESDLSIMSLADAFGIIGDLEALKRLDRFERGIDRAVRLEILMAAGRLDEATDIATTRTKAATKAEIQLWEQSWKLVEAAQKAGRGDLAVRVARHILNTTRRPGFDVPRAAAVIAAAVPAPDAIKMAEDFDRKARTTSDRTAVSFTTQDVAVAAVAAVASWTALGKTDQAASLVAFWHPRGLSWPSNGYCDSYSSGCNNAIVVEMLRRSNRLMEGFDGLQLTAEIAIVADLSDGRGLSRLDAFLAKESTVQQREKALAACVEWAVSNSDLSIATSCAKRLQQSAAFRGLSEDETKILERDGDARALTSGVYIAARRCLSVAAAAAKKNEMELSREMVGCALDLWGSVPSTRWDFFDTLSTTDVGTALLREQGRL